MADNANRTRFLDLPIEVRCMIYQRILQREVDTRLRLQNKDLHVLKEFFSAGRWFYLGSMTSSLPHMFNFAMTCRTIYSEAIVIFYRDCHLDITSLGSGSSGCLRALSRFPKSIQIARVRKLTFSFSLNHTAPNQFEKIFKLFHWGRHLNELLIVFQHPYASHDGYDNSRWRVGDGEKSMDNDDLDTHIETVTKESLVPLWKKLTFPKPILVWTSEHWAYRTWEPDVQVMMQIKGTYIMQVALAL